MVDRKVVIRSGKLEATSPVTVETSDTRYRTTTVRFENSNGKLRIQEIRLGGTSTRLVLSESGGPDAPEKRKRSERGDRCAFHERQSPAFPDLQFAPAQAGAAAS